MAKVLYTAVVADMRNKLNGSVFSKNRYGAYVRTKVTPVNPQTAAQQNVRNNLSTHSQNWRGLTETQRQGWISAAANFPFTDIFGNSKVLSGQTLYVKLNINLQIVGVAAIDDAPAPVAIPALSLGAIAADATANTFTAAFATSPVPAGFSIVYQTTPMVTAGKSFVKNLYRQIQVAPAAATTPTNLDARQIAVHGSLVAGQKVFVRAFLISNTTGQAGIPVAGLAIVV